jgi:hypothetical protein
MAEVTRGVRPSWSHVMPPPTCQFPERIAGEALVAGDMVYVRASDGRVLKANGTAATAPALAIGMVILDCQIGMPCTVVFGVLVGYSDAGTLTPGARYYVSAAVPGGLSDTATTGGTVPVAFALDGYNVFVMHPGR